MSNPNGRKGTSWESACVNVLSRWWPKVKRAAKEGAKDVGDLTHPEGWAIECKNTGAISLPRFLREAETEAENKGVPLFVALVKNRKGKGESGRAEDGYAVTRTRIWAQVAFEHGKARAALEYIAALEGRAREKSLSPEAFLVLTSEELRLFAKEMERVG